MPVLHERMPQGCEGLRGSRDRLCEVEPGETDSDAPFAPYYNLGQHANTPTRQHASLGPNKLHGKRLGVEIRRTMPSVSPASGEPPTLDARLDHAVSVTCVRHRKFICCRPARRATDSAFPLRTRHDRVPRCAAHGTGGALSGLEPHLPFTFEDGPVSPCPLSAGSRFERPPKRTRRATRPLRSSGGGEAARRVRRRLPVTAP